MEIVEVISYQSSAVSKSKFGKVGVLMGGVSAEREISLKSGKAVCESLRQLGMEFIALDLKSSDRQENIGLLKAQAIDCAFLALHGKFGEDGDIQQVLEDLGIPYTGSGVRSSRLAMDKIASQGIFEDCGLNVPGYVVIERETRNSVDFFLEQKKLNFPIVVKPAMQGSSVGLSIADNRADLENSFDLAFSFDERLLVEEYIRGREITVAILDEEALPVIEIIPKKRFFDYEAKYCAGMTEYVVPAELETKLSRDIKEKALRAHKALGCSGCSRVDMILRGNIPFILEINTIPGLTDTSLLPKAAKVRGISFAQLCVKLIELAYEKAKV